jgi:outer membrane lipoprotein-sorting protein
MKTTMINRAPAVLLLAILCAPALWAQSAAAQSAAAQNAGTENPAAEEILRRLDRGQTFDTMKSLGSMSITDSLGSRKTEFINSARGKDDSFMEFTSAAEKGQKILRNSRELYLFFPEAEEITRLQGAALRQSMAGSDISYEDLTGNRNRADNYSAVLAGGETMDGRDCWHILLEAKTRNIAYPKQEIWVDKANYLPVLVKSFALSGKQLKEIRFSGVVVVDGFPFSTRLVVEDKLKKGARTELFFRDIEINRPIPAKTFTLENLSW